MNEFLCPVCAALRDRGMDVPCVQFWSNGTPIATLCHHIILIAAQRICDEEEAKSEVIH